MTLSDADARSTSNEIRRILLRVDSSQDFCDLLPMIIGAGRVATIRLVAFVAVATPNLALADGWRVAGVRQTEGIPSSVALGNGGVAMCGTIGSDTAIHECDVWEPAAGTLKPLPSLAQPRSGAAMGVFSDGTLIVAGGSGRLGDPLATVEILSPGATEWRPFAAIPDPVAGWALPVPLAAGGFGVLLGPTSSQICHFGFFTTKHAGDTWQTVPKPPVDLCPAQVGTDALGAIAVMGALRGASYGAPPELWWWLPTGQRWSKQTIPTATVSQHKFELVQGSGRLFLRWMDGKSRTFLAPLNSAESDIAMGSAFEVPGTSFNTMAPLGEDTWLITRDEGQWSWRMGDRDATAIGGPLQNGSIPIGLGQSGLFSPASNLGTRVAAVWSHDMPVTADPCLGLTRFAEEILRPVLQINHGYAAASGYYAALDDAVSPGCRIRLQAGKAPALWTLIDAGLSRSTAPPALAAMVVLATTFQVRGAAVRALSTFRRKDIAHEARAQLLVSLARWPAAGAAFATLVDEGVFHEGGDWQVDNAFSTAAMRSDEVAARLEPLVLKAHGRDARGFDALAKPVCSRIDQKIASKKLKRVCAAGSLELTWQMDSQRRDATVVMSVGFLYGAGMIAGVASSDSPDTRRGLATVAGASTGLMVGAMVGGVGAILVGLGDIHGNHEGRLKAGLTLGAIAGGIVGGLIANGAVSGDAVDNATWVTAGGLILPVSTLLYVGKQMWPD